MKTQAFLAFALVVSFGSMAKAQCGNCSVTQHYTFKQSYMANNIWPSQYIAAARCGVNAPFAGMVNNGWRRQNLMGQYHFNPETQELTEAGRLKASWTLTQAPMHRRNLFVQQTNTEEKTAERVQSLQEFAANLNTTGEQAQINETAIQEYEHPASRVDATFVGFREAQPAPVLPAATAGTGSN
ncbi:MAG: hypothetical protein RH917_13795 [Lacipirellulaceae bacterium]